MRVASQSVKTAFMNWLPIVCAAAAYWIIGAIWYMALFGKMWAAAIQQHGVTLQRSGMAAKMIGNFLANLVAAVVMARAGLPVDPLDAAAFGKFVQDEYQTIGGLFTLLGLNVQTPKPM